jgi:hypothetical protein
MKTPDKNSGDEGPKAVVHCWDPQWRRMVCGVPGQIGSTKHVHDVTCSACLELLGAPARAPLSLVPG